MKSTVRCLLNIVAVAIFTAGLPAPTVWADVVPGDIIDKTNYQKIETLVPDFILNWIKEGDLIIKIGKLDFDPTNRFLP